MKSIRRKAGRPQDGPLETATLSDADELLAGRLGTMHQLQTAPGGTLAYESVEPPTRSDQPETVAEGEPGQVRAGGPVVGVRRLTANAAQRIVRLPARAAGRIRGLPFGALRRIPRPVTSFVVAALVLLVAVLSGTVEETDRTLVIMGFDADRAQLITTLLVSAIAAVAATLAVGRPGIGALLGTLAVAALFGQTFIVETQDALAATGALGSFDPIGWTLTLATLVVIGFIAAWAGATLAAALR
ncbi:MAG: hypothetical protein ACXWNI_05050, partial [Candidatus Limnocylindrales bacterium]